MTNLLLRDLIQDILREDYYQPQFSFKKLNSIKKTKGFTEKDKFKFTAEYLEKFFPVFGKGSSRIVFKISSKKVIKLARSEKGIAQNHHELESFLSSKDSKLLAKVYDYDPSYMWIVSELVRPIKDSADFKSLTDMDFELFLKLFKTLRFLKIKDWSQLELKLKTYQKFLDEYGPRHLTVDERFLLDNKELLESSEFFIRFYNLIQGSSFSFEDLTFLEQYGKTAEGRLVVLDYGLSDEIYDRLYLNKL